MLSKLIVIQCIIITVFVVKVESQICVKKEVVTRSVNVTYKGTAYVTYRLAVCSYRCIRRRRTVVTKNRINTITELADVKHCCSGYTRVDASSNDSSIKCEPICMPSCKNGYCESPAKCGCHPGYVSDPVDSHSCVPICKKPCTNGACVAPNICQCNFGYEFVNDSCQPICTEPCHNGTCVAPETCVCHAGYRKSEQNTCEPYCSIGCENGACIAPEECSCNPGYRLTESIGIPNKICKPFCSENCTNGVCIAPEQCQCWPSYKQSENNYCEPVCEYGWVLKDHKCVAQCKYSCGNGTCMSPNVCVCYPGYHIDFGRLSSSGYIIDAALCVPSCTNCSGACVAPNVCVREQRTTTDCDGLCDEQQTATDMTENTIVTSDDFDLLYNDTSKSGHDGYNNDPINNLESSNGSIGDEIIENVAASSCSIECEPICMPACKNGYCESPAKCGCHPGYVSDPVDSHSCVPICKKPCTNGACVAPNICQCNFGYEFVNDSCQPICTEPCHNGTCVAPETCECHAGYRKSEQNTCEPYCSIGCENGACIAPEECSCNPGYRLTESIGIPNKICKPFCSENCTNGVCIAPEQCQCWPSYKVSENNYCEPVCEYGWVLKDHKCVAQCKYSCGNGTCMSPNVCVCYPGYHIDFGRLSSSGYIIDAALCVPSCTNCSGACVAPNVCVREQRTTTDCDGLCDEQQTATDMTENTIVTSDDFDLLYNDTSKSGHDGYNNDPINNLESSNGSIGDEIIENVAASSWIAEHWVPIFVPIMCIIAAAILVYVVYQYTPVFVFFKGKSYIVKNGPREESYSFEDVRIRFSNDKKT